VEKTSEESRAPTEVGETALPLLEKMERVITDVTGLKRKLAPPLVPSVSGPDSQS